MNPYQALARLRQDRRFTRGDGVLILDGPHLGRRGFVLYHGTVTLGCEAQRRYDVVFTDGAPAEGGVFRSIQLQSDPSGNTGKYGGPSRGGEPDGWLGQSGYHRR